MSASDEPLKIPWIEIFKTIPGVFGIRLEEGPPFQVVRREGKIEIRNYDKILLAQLSVKGVRQEALDEGFLRLAAYIFGKNRRRLQISMTHPVYQKKDAEAIAMTSPVYQEEKGGAWIISFVMPSKFNRSNVPEPLDEEIQLVELPERTVAVLKYSGNNTEKKMRQAKLELKEWLSGSGFSEEEEIYWAQYDPPFAIPFFKKNEAQVPLTEKKM